MSLWKGLMSLCMVWLNCLFAILFFCFFFVWLFYWGVCQNVCCCFCFYSWGLCSPCISLSSYSTCKDVFFWILHLCFNPQLSSFPLPSVLLFGRGQHLPKPSFMLWSGWNKLTTNRRNTLHQLPALKAPLPLTHPAGDWGVRYLTDQEYWELHRTL